VAKAGQAGRQVDPICGRKLPAGGGQILSTEYKKRTYFFCSRRCQAAFHRRTERFHLQELAQAGALFLQGKVRWGIA
jgi:YHS domain-containing protein